MKQRYLLLIIAVLLVIAGIGYYLWSNKPSQPAIQTIGQNPPIKATFNCAGGKSINAEFNNNQVNLKLSDKRTISLPRALSASGARYANSDESFVFWNKGDTAFIEENGKTTFTDCLTAGQN